MLVNDSDNVPEDHEPYTNDSEWFTIKIAQKKLICAVAANIAAQITKDM